MSNQARFAFADMNAAVSHSIEILRTSFFDPERNPTGLPFWGGFSGGKDSVVIKQLIKEAGVPCDWHYSVTTIDPPELVRFINQHHREVLRKTSDKFKNFGDLIEAKGLPTRALRFCCRIFKEHPSPDLRTHVFGIRAEESARRKAVWPIFQKSWKVNDGGMLCPILHWTEADVWEFIDDRNLPYCELYDQGWSRIGCIACPMQSFKQRREELARYPHIERMLRDGVRRLWERRGETWRYRQIFASHEEMFEWWMSDVGLPKYSEKETQGNLF